MILSKAALFATSLAVFSTRNAGGMLVLNEIMRNPAGVATEREGEWFELFNPTTNAVDINGWIIKDDGTNSHVIDNGAPLYCPPGGYIVLGNNANLTTNGGVTLDYEYDKFDIQLNNNAFDELVILAGDHEVDRVNWDGGNDGASFPNQDGNSMSLLHPTLLTNVGSNWCNAVTPYGDKGNTGTPGAPNDCPPPFLLINEVMRNPENVATERKGEWIEIYNPTDRTYDINGWTIKDDGTNKHYIDNGGPLEIAPLGYLVLSNNDDFATNGGVLVDYQYEGERIKLNNLEDELVLLAGSLEVDRVNWVAGNIWPDEAGSSMSLLHPTLDNNVGSNWCNAVTPFGAGDLGTPGASNDCSAPELVINEVMRNPKNVATEREGEWFELFNPTDRTYDINQWVIKDDGTNSFVINNGGPLIIAPGSYLVLGNNADVGSNGGVTLDYEYDSTRIHLNNGADELVLMAASFEVDRVNWDGGVRVSGVWPNTNGASMALKNPNFDNSLSSNWCDASTVFGEGDMGTPGAANDCLEDRRLEEAKATRSGVRGSV